MARLYAWWCVGALGAATPLCAAPRLLLEVERIETPVGRLEGVRLEIAPGEGGAHEAELRVARLDSGESGYRFSRLRWRCPLRIESAGDAWSCRGELRARGHERAVLDAAYAAGRLDLQLSGGTGQLSLGAGAGEDTRVRLASVPVAWLQPLLAAYWAEASLTGGTVEAELALGRDGAGTPTLAGPLALRQVGFDTRDGLQAAASLHWDGRLALAFAPQATRVDLQGRFSGGEFLAGPLYVTLPSTPVDMAIEAVGQGEGRWRLPRIHWRDGGVLELDADAAFDAEAPRALRVLKGRLALPDLATAHPRYLATLLAQAGLSGATLGGGAQVQAAMRDGSWQSIELGFEAASLRDEAGRFAMEELSGSLPWHTGEPARDGALDWHAARLHGLVLDASRVELESRGGSIALRAPARIASFGGHLGLDRFAWQPASDTSGAKLDLALELQDVDLAQLSRAMGWPVFAGSLSGRIPAVRYEQQVLHLDGGLTARLFDGELKIDALALERPFGVAPTLAAGVAFQALDLQPLTAAFGFGEISGRLDGRIAGLRLVDWSPVAFEADLHSTPGARGSRRISRRAVDDLSRVGGGGFAAGLQAQVLKLFDTFGYERIGLKCRLAGNVCHMDGLDSSGPGYVIVEGSGLPRITVIGHQRQVDWPVLVARLKAATEGQSPIIQ